MTLTGLAAGDYTLEVRAVFASDGPRTGALAAARPALERTGDLPWVIASIIGQIHHFVLRRLKRRALEGEPEAMAFMQRALPAIELPLPEYVRQGILPNDPFQQLDQEGVGQLVKQACQLGRKANPELHLGICGEHGGHAASIAFCHRIGLTYVSCSAPRVPIARLAAAHAA